MEVAKYFLLGCVDSANLASGIRGDRSEERKSWGWRLHNESGLELESEVCTGLCISVYMYLCVHVCMCLCPSTPVSVSLCACTHVHACPCRLSTSLCVHVPVCAPTRVCLGALLPVVQQLSIWLLLTQLEEFQPSQRQFWENGSFWKGWECCLLW